LLTYNFCQFPKYITFTYPALTREGNHHAFVQKLEDMMMYVCRAIIFIPQSWMFYLLYQIKFSFSHILLITPNKYCAMPNLAPDSAPIRFLPAKMPYSTPHFKNRNRKSVLICVLAGLQAGLASALQSLQIPHTHVQYPIASSTNNLRFLRHRHPLSHTSQCTQMPCT